MSNSDYYVVTSKRGEYPDRWSLGNTPQKQTVRRQADGARLSVGFLPAQVAGEACVGRVPSALSKEERPTNLNKCLPGYP